MYSVLDICRYIINYSNRQGYGISNLKLQKLLYFVQAVFLLFTSNPCFSEQIQAWDFGPVVPEAYHEFKKYGGLNIPQITTYEVISLDSPWKTETVTFNENVINAQDRRLIDQVVDIFKGYSASALVDITHRQSPWKTAYQPGMNQEITNDAIREYFDARRTK